MGDDLWGYGNDEPEPDHFSDSSDDQRKQRSNTEEADLLPLKKRRKLQQLGYGGGGGRRRGRRGAKGGSTPGQAEGGDEEVIALDSNNDSDKKLLREAGRGGTKRSTASNSATAFSVVAAAGYRQSSGTAPSLDPRSAQLLQQVQAIQQRLKAAQADDLSDDDSEPLELSPVVGWGGAAAAARQRQQQQRQRRGGGSGEGEQYDLSLTDDASRDGTPASGPAARGEEEGDTPGTRGGAGGSGAAPPAPATAADGGDRIPLKLRSARHGEKVLRMKKDDTFDKLFAVYRKWAAGAGHIPSADAPVRFIFDGEHLQPGKTPAGLDLEGEECIDVHF